MPSESVVGGRGIAASLSRRLEALRAYTHPRVRTMLFLGYSSGLPFLLVLLTLGARLKQAGINRSTIGYFTWVGLAYSLKYLWSPMVDRLNLPLLRALGRRRSWMLLSQLMVAYGLMLMAWHDPGADPVHMAFLAIFVAFFAATQDIAVDAFRIEAAELDVQGAMAAAYQIGYSLALITAGALCLHLAAAHGWTYAYCVMAALMGVGLLTVLLIKEPSAHIDRATIANEARVLAFIARSAHWPNALRAAMAWLIGAVACPFIDFFKRNGWRPALTIIALITTYRLNYMSMGVMANPFYLDMGFSLDQIAVVSKVYGVIMSLTGSVLAGVLVARIGIPRTLLLGVLLLSGANLVYAYIAEVHPGLWWLSGAIGIDSLGNGVAGTAFIAYMSSLTSTAYTATQYALFGTLWSLPAKGLAGFSGRIVDAIGYREFFVYTAVLGLPAVVLVLLLIRRSRHPEALPA